MRCSTVLALFGMDGRVAVEAEGLPVMTDDEELLAALRAIQCAFEFVRHVAVLFIPLRPLLPHPAFKPVMGNLVQLVMLEHHPLYFPQSARRYVIIELLLQDLVNEK
jgi:hypothetical protein